MCKWQFIFVTERGLAVWFLAVRARQPGWWGSRWEWGRSRATPPSAPSVLRGQHSSALEQTCLPTLLILILRWTGRGSSRKPRTFNPISFLLPLPPIDAYFALKIYIWFGPFHCNFLGSYIKSQKVSKWTFSTFFLKASSCLGIEGKIVLVVY